MPDARRTLLKGWLVAVVLGLAAGRPDAARDAGQADAVQARITRIEAALAPPVIVAGRSAARPSLADRMRELRVPGVSVAVFEAGKLSWARGYGAKEAPASEPVTADTLFQAASISKPVAAAAAMILVDRGLLALDENINKVLKTWKLPENDFTRSKPVTLRHLLSHSAGTTVSGFRGYAANEPVPTLVQLLDGAKPANSAAVRVDIAPGERWRYSGGGYSIVQLAIEDVTGKPFPAALRELVLGPAGMTKSTYEQPLPDARAPEAAIGHRPDGTPVAGRWHTHPEMAAAGLWTTPSDLARFALAIREASQGGRPNWLSQARARDMLTTQIGGHGLGPGVSGEGAARRYGHGGSNVGYRCTLEAFVESGDGIAVMTNSDRGSIVAGAIIRTAAAEYGWPGLGPIERTPGASDPARYPDYAGVYVMQTRSPPVEIAIAVEEGRLFRGAGPGRSELLPEKEGVFFALDGDFRIAFVRGADGKVSEAIVTQGTQSNRAERKP